MAGIYITLSLTTAFVFSILQNVLIKLKRIDAFTLEIHFVYLSVTFKKKEKRLSLSKKSRAERKPRQFYLLLIQRIKKLLSRSYVTVDSLSLPPSLTLNRSEVGPSFITPPIMYAIIALLLQNTRGVTLKRETFPFYDTSDELSFDITVKVPLIYLITFFTSVRYDTVKTKIKKRSVYVRE